MNPHYLPQLANDRIASLYETRDQIEMADDVTAPRRAARRALFMRLLAGMTNDARGVLRGRAGTHAAPRLAATKAKGRA